MKELREGFEKNLEKNGSGVLMRITESQFLVVEMIFSSCWFVPRIISWFLMDVSIVARVFVDGY